MLCAIQSANYVNNVENCSTANKPPPSSGAESPSTQPAVPGEVLFQRQFEGTDPMEGLAFTSRTTKANGSYNYPTLSRAHAREGRQSLRIQFDHRYNTDRAEYKIGPLPGQKGSAVEPFYSKTDNVPWGACEVYIGFSVYLPSTWTETTGGAILMQLHQYNAPSGPSNPPFALSARDDGHFWATSRWSTRTTPRTQVDYDLGPIAKDQWVDFQIRIKLSYTAADGGLTIRRRNPKTESTFTQLAHFEGTRGTLNEPYGDSYVWGPEYKFGMYKWIYGTSGSYVPAANEQTVWELWQDSHVVSKCNAGNWDMVTPSGQGF